MQISPHLGDLDPTQRRRQLDRAKGGTDHAGAAKPLPSGDASAISLPAAEVARYVDMLKNMDPQDLHRVDELRARIADGSYSSDLSELVDPLLNFLGNEPA